MAKALGKEDVRRNPLAVWIANGVQFIRDHKRLVVGALAGVLAVAVAASVYTWYQARQERDAQRVLGTAQLARAGEAGVGSKTPDQVRALYGEVASKYPRTVAAEEALVRLGDLEFQGGKYGEAIAAFGDYLTRFPRGRFLVMAGIGKAYAEEAKGDLPAAEKTLSRVVDRGKDDPLAGEAYSSLARVYEAMGKPEDAVRVYGQIADRFTQTHWAQNALQRMSVLKSK